MDSRYAQIDAAEKERLPRASSESDITLLDHGESKTRVRLGPLWLWILQVALLLTSLVFFAAGLVIRPSTRTYVERFSAWTPAAEAISYHTTILNSTDVYSSPYAGAGPEVDHAWEHITTHLGDQAISAAELANLNKSAATHLRTPDNAATGAPAGFRVELAVAHHLHCLNLLRQAVHPEAYSAPQGGEYRHGAALMTEREKRAHLDHCIESLRQKLTCDADVSVLTYFAEPDMHGALRPDYASSAVCRDFERVRAWAVANKVADKEVF
ncbi:uncharacterized protein K452DRAFT_302521 [Aplosporella prunicola CBS 121167]|uniref:DUF3328 domain-containing protein n=1 Tax=Aplosporella prunicola CBS 121167 TaxID=1176127 RepID=A0A6A6B1Y1_9PEZI|nr:uncharacterized protein K452DRAFT_302521 [Aplosporella prunicola CBS 121167]KAF2136741.1 hypothetical protein K452DRAFT_302521 [Aplosporella prunicola CBS 121167]